MLISIYILTVFTTSWFITQIKCSIVMKEKEHNSVGRDFSSNVRRQHSAFPLVAGRISRLPLLQKSPKNKENK